ncbi:MAG: tyrosine--tRNA ligase [Acidobacteria bacterium]|nr:MAG: tyrosine--tRNA ligase [Acidobacteriota bacterium]
MRLKLGLDPTAPDIHLGHTVVLRKMRAFQEMGHEGFLVIGDFTARIGDPSGRSKTRPPLSTSEIEANARTYTEQAFKILDASRTQVVFNSEWLDGLRSSDWIFLAAQYNVARMLERRDFRQRFESGQPISLHEFLYPLAQAYDSIHLKADVELGGTDQLFNLNVGRDVMPAYGLEPQVVMTTPLLEGLDGVEKMSKSLGNHVGIQEPPLEMFGKLMSISDELMWRYWALLTELSAEEVEGFGKEVASGRRHPKEMKAELARRIVSDFHGAEEAERAGEEWRRVFSQHEVPAELPEIRRSCSSEPIWLPRLLVDAGLVKSTSDALRTIRQGGLDVDGTRVEEKPATLDASRPAVHLLKFGKRRFLRVIIG